MSKKTQTTKTKEKLYIVSDTNLNLLRACIESNSPALLIGETGTGKTTLIREVAKEKKKNLIRISLNGATGVEELKGKLLIEKGTTKWQDGILVSAMRNGDWVVLDEINAALPEVLFILHSLLDEDRKVMLEEKDNEAVVPHKDFRFFATMNPPDEYAGTKDMNKALLSRFTAVLNVEVLSESDEVKLLGDKGADNQTALKLVSAATFLRKKKKENDIFYFCSTRDLVQAVDLVKQGLDLKEAFLGAVVNKMSSEELGLVDSELRRIIATEIKLPTKTIAELIKLVEDNEKEKEKYKKELKSKFDEKVKQIEAEAMKKANDQVSDEFLMKLKELAGK